MGATLSGAGGGPLSVDEIARTKYHWPEWMDICHGALIGKNLGKVARLTDVSRGSNLEDRLARDEGLRGSILRIHELALKAELPGPRQQQSLEDQLILDALAEGRQEPQRLLEGGEPVRMPLLYTIDGKARRGRLQLWHLFLEAPAVKTPLVLPAPASSLYRLSDEWRDAAQDAANAVIGLVGPCAPGVAWIWDVYPADETEPIVNLSGRSAGAAFALAMARSMARSLLDPKLRTAVWLIDFSRVLLSATLTARGELGAVHPIDEKLSAFNGLLASMPPSHVFVATDQVVDSTSLQVCRCSDLEALIRHAGGRCGGWLSAPQAELLDLLVRGETVAGPYLVRRVANERPRSLRGYLVHRWAIHAHGSAHVRIDPGVVERPTFVNLTLETGESGLDQISCEEALRLVAENDVAFSWRVEGRRGTGKTSVLAAYEMARCRAALIALENGEPPREVCVWIDLEDLLSPVVGTLDRVDSRVDAQWEDRYPHMPTWRSIVAEPCRVRFVFDRAAQPRTAENPSQTPEQAVVGELHQWLASSRDRLAPPIFAGLPVSPELSDQMAVATLRLGPLRSEQVGRRCRERRLSDYRTALLLHAIDRNREVARLCELPVVDSIIHLLLHDELARIVFFGRKLETLVNELHRGLHDVPSLVRDSAALVSILLGSLTADLRAIGILSRYWSALDFERLDRNSLERLDGDLFLGLVQKDEPEEIRPAGPQRTGRIAGRMPNWWRRLLGRLLLGGTAPPLR